MTTETTTEFSTEATTGLSADTLRTAAARDATAPMRIELSVELDLPPERVFHLVAHDLPSWFQGIGQVTWNHGAVGAPHAGSERTCHLGRDRLYESIRFWEPGRAYAYSVDMDRSTVPFPVRDHLATFTVEPMRGGRTKLTWRQYYNKRLHPMALFVTWMIKHRLMRPALRRLVRQHRGRFLS